VTPRTVEVDILRVHNGFGRFGDALTFAAEETITFEVTFHSCSSEGPPLRRLREWPHPSSSA